MTTSLRDVRNRAGHCLRGQRLRDGLRNRIEVGSVKMFLRPLDEITFLPTDVGGECGPKPDKDACAGGDVRASCLTRQVGEFTMLTLCPPGKRETALLLRREQRQERPRLNG